MTLYWWMHWFWVTAQIAGCTVFAASLPTTESAIENVTVTPPELASKQGFLFTKSDDNYSQKIGTQNRPVPPKVIGINAVNLSNRTRNNAFNNVTQSHPENKLVEKPGSIAKSSTQKKEMLKNIKSTKPKQEEVIKNVTQEESLAVVPLSAENSSMSNTSNPKIWNGTAINSNNQISGKYTEKLVLASASPASTEESSRTNRARDTLGLIPRDQTQRDQQLSKFSNESPVGVYSGSGTSPTDIAIITLSCLSVVVLISMAGSVGFIMYRRKYLNPPQTLNSDKCSNPDSSGYIDDSTIRDNSEEMYSLDNDSFLNSLEAMTIQNYWTDSVKHTKL